MGAFNADMLRAVALGPDPNRDLLKFVEEAANSVLVFEDDPYSKEVRQNAEKTLTEYKRRNWTCEQKELYYKSRDLLYAMVMLRAAAFLDDSMQDKAKEIPEERKIAEAHLIVRITSNSANVTANGAGAESHKMHPADAYAVRVAKENPRSARLKAAATATDDKLNVAVHRPENPFVAVLVDEWVKLGAPCPDP